MLSLAGKKVAARERRTAGARRLDVQPEQILFNRRRDFSNMRGANSQSLRMLIEAAQLQATDVAPCTASPMISGSLVMSCGNRAASVAVG